MTFLETHLPVLQIIVPLLGAPIVMMLRHRLLSWLITTLISFFILYGALKLLFTVQDGSVIIYELGNWDRDVGIIYKVDIVNAYMLVIIGAISAVVLPYAKTSVDKEIPHDKHHLFYSALLLCITGLMGICITGDAFNVFVFLEVSSLSGYALIAMGKAPHSLTAAYRYLVMGTVGGTFILLGIGFLYMMTGTLNMDVLVETVPGIAETTTARAAFAFLTVGASIKLALFPLHMWLPNCYTYAPSVISAFLSATATKISFYVMVRVTYVIFGAAMLSQATQLKFVVLPLALLGIFMGSLSAIKQVNVKKLLAYSSIAQVGYMVLGFSFNNLNGLTGGILHLFNHSLMKGGLFLVVGCVVYRLGNSDIEDFRGLGKRMPYTMFAFALGGLSMIGVPLTAGFVSKWYLILGALDAGLWWVVMLILFASMLAVVYVWKVIEAAYFTEPLKERDCKEAPLSLLIPAYVLILASVYFGIVTEPMRGAAESAAKLLLSAGGVL